MPAKTDAPADAEETAYELLRATSRLRARLRSETWSEERPWSWSQVGTLVRIVDGGPTTTSELAAAEHVRRQSMAETIAALRELGLVETAPDPSDGRKLLITATGKGRELRQAVPAARGAWMVAMIGEHLSAEETETLRRAAGIMQRIADL